MTLPLIPNAVARRLFLDRHALAEAPVGPASGGELARLVGRIGFVQVDSITTVARAHDMILWSRRQAYRPPALKRLLEKDRSLWEHWTHDASILPVSEDSAERLLEMLQGAQDPVGEPGPAVKAA